MGTILAVALALLAPPAASALDVTVATDAGAPIGGAEVVVWGDGGNEALLTDAEGRARFAGVPPGSYSVRASAAGFVGDERHAVEVAAGADVAVRFALPPGVPFSGRVVDQAGRPVAGAYVEAVAGGSFEGYGETKMRAPYARTWTSEDGAFRIGGIPEGAVSTLLVRAEGSTEARVAVRALGGAVRPSPLLIVLESGGRLTGRVAGPDGRPVPGAAVLVVPAGDEDLRRNPHITKWSTGREGVTQAIAAETGEDGRFDVQNLALGEAFVALAEATGFARSAESAVFTLDAGHREVEIALVLRKSGTILLKLTDPGGAPVSKARVRIGEHMSGLEKEEAEAPGIFRFVDLPPGRHEVHVTAPGFVPRNETVELAEGETKELALALSTGESIEGTVVDGEGQPVPGVTVRAERTVTSSDGWTSQSEAGRGDSDASGRFAVRGLASGPHVLDILADGYILPGGEVKVDAPARDLTLVAARLGSVNLRLKAPEGVALPEKVFVWDYSPDGSRSGGSHALAGDLLHYVAHPGRHRIRVLAEGCVPVEREVEFVLGKDEDLGEATIDPGVTLSGRVVDLAGNPVASALVSHSDYTQASTDADGRFALEHVPSGAIEVDVAAEGFLDLSAKVSAGKDAAPAALALSRGGLLRGTLKDGGGRPLPDHWLQVRKPSEVPGEKGEHVDEFGTDEDGRFEIRLPAGRYVLMFVENESFAVLAEFELAEGEGKDVAPVLGRR